MKRYTLIPEALSTQGEGIARVKGKVIFVPFVLPGETCEAVLVETHKNFSRALPLDISNSDPERLAYEKTTPPCPVFGLCGGCQLQHVAYADQLRLKREWLIETFRRVAHIDVDCPLPVASPPLSYRNKITLPVIEIDGKLELAYHQIYQPKQFVPVEDCPIAAESLRGLISALRDGLRETKPILKPHGKQSSSGSRAILRIMNETIRVHIEDTLFRESDLTTLHERFVTTGLIDEMLLFVVGANRSIETMQLIRDGLEPELYIDSFLQVNDSIREALYEHVLALPFDHQETLIDGYCGVGDLSCRFADRFQNIIGVESDPHSSQDAQHRILQLGLQDRVSIQQRNLEAFLFTAQTKYKTIVLNPPRAGLSAEARSATLQHKPADLVLISCHPAALARDVAHFQEHGYRLSTLQPFDMFPQTYHYEMVAHLNTSVR